MTQTIGNAVAQRDQNQNAGAKALVQQYAKELTTVLPPQLTPQAQAWLQTAVSALRVGKIVRAPNGQKMYELEMAALNNPHAYVRALREAANNGLTPGTSEYYLTPRMNSGKMEILGIIGYQGYVEQMYRAGYVSAVVVDVVRENDQFDFVRGRDEIPIHIIDWRSKDRGEIILAYAYARMVSGGFSDTVVLNEQDIEEIKKSAQGADSKYSPWKNFPKAMWKKSAARQLKKWVPTSSVDRRAMQIAATIVQAAAPVTPLPQEEAPRPGKLQPEIGQDIVDAELVDEPGGEMADHPPIPDEAPAAEPAAEAPAPPVQEPPARTARKSAGAARQQATDLGKLFGQKGFRDDEDRHEFVKATLEMPGLSQEQALTADQVTKVIAALNALSDVKQDG